MKRFWTLFLSIIMCACCLFSFTACQEKKTVDNNSIVNPRTETVKVGVIDYAPLNYMYKNTYKGFNTELAVMTFNALGYNVEFVLIEPQSEDDYIPTANDVYTALEEGDIDCFWGGLSDAILFDEERADFSYPYLYNPLCLVKSTYAGSISSIEDLEDMEIAFGTNSAGEIYYENNLIGTVANLSATSCERGQKSALHKVKSVTDPINFAIVDALMAFYQKYNGEYSQISITDIDLNQNNQLRVVFKKQEEKNELRDNVNAMLKSFASIKKDGECIITSLAEKYKFNTPAGLSIKSVADFIITDFDNVGGENGGSGLSSNPNTVPVPPSWV